MSDITYSLAEALQKHNARICSHRRMQSDTTDEFLKEAYRINSHIASLYTYLRSIRQAYLSTSLPPHHPRNNNRNNDETSAIAGSLRSQKLRNSHRKHLTDEQRNQIDAESKSTLRDLNAGIRQLEEVETLRRDTEAQIAAKKRARNNGYISSTLGRWAAGDTDGGLAKLSPEERLDQAQREAVNMHRESVIWYLRRKLEEAAEVQRGMMETRLEREIERSKSVLYKTKGLRGGQQESSGLSTAAEGLGSSDNGTIGDVGGSNGDARFGGGASGGSGGGGKNAAAVATAIDEAQRRREREIEQTLSPEQLQLFAQENNEMLKRYEDTLDQVRTAERSMLEISELQTTLAQNLEMQATRIDQLVDDSANTEQNVAGGNRQLKRAVERWRPAKILFRATCVLSLFLIGWDLLF